VCNNKHPSSSTLFCFKDFRQLTTIRVQKYNSTVLMVLYVLQVVGSARLEQTPP
jgi:hypothetical protein